MSAQRADERAGLGRDARTQLGIRYRVYPPGPRETRPAFIADGRGFIEPVAHSSKHSTVWPISVENLPSWRL